MRSSPERGYCATRLSQFTGARFLRHSSSCAHRTRRTRPGFCDAAAVIAEPVRLHCMAVVDLRALLPARPTSSLSCPLLQRWPERGVFLLNLGRPAFVDTARNLYGRDELPVLPRPSARACVYPPSKKGGGRDSLQRQRGGVGLGYFFFFFFVIARRIESPLESDTLHEIAGTSHIFPACEDLYPLGGERACTAAVCRPSCCSGLWPSFLRPSLPLHGNGLSRPQKQRVGEGGRCEQGGSL